MSDIFQSSIRRMNRCSKIYREFKVTLDAYRKKCSVSWKTSGPDEDGYYNHTSFLDPSIPVELEDSAADYFHNLRTALDFLVSDVARLKNVKLRNTKFPFAKNNDELGKIFEDKRNRYDRLGLVFRQIVEFHKPFMDGNPILRSLHDIDIISKHSGIIEIAFSQDAELTDLGWNLLGTMIINQANPGYFFDPENPQPLRFPKKILVPINQNIRSISGELKDFNIKFWNEGNNFIPMIKRDYPFGGNKVIDCMLETFCSVNDVISDFEQLYKD
jgi:hypothetical protein